LKHTAKLYNEYAAAFGKLYADTPKTVFAAIAYSFAMRLSEDQPKAALALFAEEWQILHVQGIVPQRPKQSGKSRETERAPQRAGVIPPSNGRLPA
jgi:hypothetical protein